MARDPHGRTTDLGTGSVPSAEPSGSLLRLRGSQRGIPQGSRTPVFGTHRRLAGIQI